MLYDNMSEQEYRNMDAINASALKDYIKSPLLYLKRYVQKLMPNEPTEAMEFGTALHMYALEPEEFQKTFIVKPENIDFRTKEGKAWKADNEDKKTLTQKELSLIEWLIESAYRRLNETDLLKDAKEYKEVVITHIDDDFFKFKGKMDWLLEYPGRIINVDLKTCNSLEDDKLVKTIKDFGYDLSMAFYDWLLRLQFNKPVNSYLLFVDKVTTDARLICIDNFIHAQKNQMKLVKSIKNLKDSLLSDNWETDKGGLSTLEIPKWY